jgi:hypothetical protein
MFGFKKRQVQGQEVDVKFREIFGLANFGMDIVDYYRSKAENQGGAYQEISQKLTECSLKESLTWADEQAQEVYHENPDDIEVYRMFVFYMSGLLSGGEL